MEIYLQREELCNEAQRAQSLLTSKQKPWQPTVQKTSHVPGGAATCSERFCKMFFESSPGCWAVLQLHCCPSKQGELSENLLKNLRNKRPPHLLQREGHSAGRSRGFATSAYSVLGQQGSCIIISQPATRMSDKRLNTPIHECLSGPSGPASFLPVQWQSFGLSSSCATPFSTLQQHTKQPVRRI